jgi:hypothetical protein
MAATPLLGLELPVTGTLSGTWGDAVNNQITSLIDTAVAGTTTISTDADVTLTTTDSAANQARSAVLLFSGARTAIRTVIAPARSKVYVVINNTTGGFGVKLAGPGPTTGVTIANGEEAIVAWNGTDFIRIANLGGPGAFTTLTATDGSGISALNASNLSSGTVPDARFPATLPVASGVNLTNLPAGNLTGAVAQARLSTAFNASGSAPFYAVRAWVYFNAIGTLTVLGSGNCTVVDNATGDFTVNFTTAMPSANYGIGAMCSQNTLSSTNGFSVGTKAGTTLAAGSVTLAVKNIGTAGGIDPSECCVIFVA